MSELQSRTAGSRGRHLPADYEDIKYALVVDHKYRRRRLQVLLALDLDM